MPISKTCVLDFEIWSFDIVPHCEDTRKCRQIRDVHIFGISGFVPRFSNFFRRRSFEVRPMATMQMLTSLNVSL